MKTTNMVTVPKVTLIFVFLRKNLVDLSSLLRLHSLCIVWLCIVPL